MKSLSYTPEMANIAMGLSNPTLAKNSIIEFRSFANPPKTIYTLFKHYLKA